MNEIIHEFFAVTKNSVYIAKNEINEKGCPVVEKIALKGKGATPIGRKLVGGYNIGIMLKTGLVLFASSVRHKQPELINIQQWGESTSPIVALFLEESAAIECFNSEDTTTCDPRWKNETLETLDKIGNDHPVFIPSITEGPSCCY